MVGVKNMIHYSVVMVHVIFCNYSQVASWICKYFTILASTGEYAEYVEISKIVQALMQLQKFDLITRGF